MSILDWKCIYSMRKSEGVFWWHLRCWALIAVWILSSTTHKCVIQMSGARPRPFNLIFNNSFFCCFYIPCGTLDPFGAFCKISCVISINNRWWKTFLMNAMGIEVSLYLRKSYRRKQVKELRKNRRPKKKKKRKTDGAERERKWKKRAEKQGHKDRISHHYREKERWFSGFVSLILST